ncbi:MAG: hypothetical protein PHS80_06700 [Methanothrix sp.]|nr:hypothetical protein [Methanothrix sp.]MDD4448480.1 hypothetical protein [Methanothrix sp.]
MTVTFEPHKRLEHLEDYAGKINFYLPLEEARIQLLRCRLVGYSLVAEMKEEPYTRKYIDLLIAQAYQTLSAKAGREIVDPYIDPCTSQYIILDELRSYISRDQSEPFMKFIRAEFKKVFVPTLRLMTELCKSNNKYTWAEVKDQLQDIMLSLNVDVTWDECEERLERYMKKIEPVLEI